MFVMVGKIGETMKLHYYLGKMLQHGRASVTKHLPFVSFDIDL
jgi:hypothetical protein